MSGIYASSLLILFFAPRAAALLSRFRSTFLRWRSSLTFIDHSEDGHKAPIPTTPYPASTLAEEAYRALIDTTYLQHTIQMILETVHDKLAPGTLCPSYLYYWSFWLQTQPITVTFAPYSNQTKWGGWVVKEKDNQEFNVSILRDLAELTQETPPGYFLGVIHFRFCFAVTVIHELTNLLTKWAFPNEVNPIVPYAMLPPGEFCEQRMLGGRLVCEWEVDHVADFRFLRKLYIRSLFSGEDYPLEESDILGFLEKLHNPIPTTLFKFNLANKESSTTPTDRVRTVAQDGRIRAYNIQISNPAKARIGLGIITAAAAEKSGDGRTKSVFTGPMTGIGKCYARSATNHDSDGLR